LLQLDEPTLKEGSRLYRLHCLHCHGLTGDGRGPTARWVNPHPRDFRQGIFKFQSVDQVTDGVTRPPRREDLYRTLQQGVEGTAMQSYNMLPDNQLHALISYVMHLSIRGDVEMQVVKNATLNKKTNRLMVNGVSITAFVRGKRQTGGTVREVAE